MTIVIPRMPQLEVSLPKLDPARVPEDEREALAHINHLLGNLVMYQENFLHAVLLFDTCTQIRQQALAATLEQAKVGGKLNLNAINLNILASVEPTIGGWQEVAARDGVMTIYNFGGIVAAIRSGLPACPSLKVDHSKVRLAYKLFFDGTFRNHKDIRDVLGHAAKFQSTLAQRRQHSHSGPLRFALGSVVFERPHPMAVTQMTGNLAGDVYMVTFMGKPYGYRIHMATARPLDTIRKLIYSAISVE